MNKLKKVGLTALAGSLVATSVVAGDFSVSGSASLTYTSQGGDAGGAQSSGNSWTMGDSLTFSGGGDLDNGMAISMSFELDDDDSTGFDDHSMTLTLNDDMGSITFSGHGGSGGAAAKDDVMPYAYNEVWDGLQAGGSHGLAGSGVNGNNSFRYQGTWAGFAIDAMYTNDGSTTHSDSSMAVEYSDLMDGLTIGYAQADDGGTSDDSTMYVKYVMGGLTVGAQASEVNFDAAASTDEEALVLAATFAVNENLTVGFAQMDVEFDSSTLVDQEDSGFGVSYTMGSITIGGDVKQRDNVSGSSGKNNENTELNIAFAF